MDYVFTVVFLTVFLVVLLESVPNVVKLLLSITLDHNVFSVTLVVKFVLIMESVRYVMIQIKSQIQSVNAKHVMSASSVKVVPSIMFVLLVLPNILSSKETVLLVRM
jgi:hypothetical protein